MDSVGPPADIWLWHLSDMPAYPETFTGGRPDQSGRWVDRKVCIRCWLTVNYFTSHVSTRTKMAEGCSLCMSIRRSRQSNGNPTYHSRMGDYGWGALVQLGALNAAPQKCESKTKRLPGSASTTPYHNGGSNENRRRDQAWVTFPDALKAARRLQWLLRAMRSLRTIPAARIASVSVTSASSTLLRNCCEETDFISVVRP